ncbi:MAG: hypothetical protein ACK4Q5_09920 [Saprospiraceae bacterium]
MNQLDDFLKHKLDHEANGTSERFAFREAYWREAEALIEADERARRRRRWLVFWRWTGATALFLMAIFWWLHSQREGSFSAENTAAPNTQIARPEPSVSEKNTPASVVPASENPAQNQSQKPPANPSAGTPQTQRQPFSGTSKNAPQAHLFKSAVGGRQFAAGSRQSTVGNEQPAADGRQSAANQSTNQPINQPTNTEAIPATNQNPEIGNRKPEIALLPVPLVPVKWAKTDRNKPEPLACPMPYPVATRRFQFGPTASGAWAANAPSGGAFGFAAGLTAKFQLNERFSLHLDALARRRADVRQPDFDTETSEQVRYGFGVERDFFTLTPLAESWWAELPISLQWQPSRIANWRLEIGANPGFFMAQRGRLQHLTNNSFNVEERLESSEKVWLAAPSVRKNYLGAFGGAHWQTPVRGLQIGARAHFLPKSLIVNDEIEPGQATRLWVDLGVRWFIFSR